MDRTGARGGGAGGGVRPPSDRILVVDDERFFQDLMADILRGAGYEADVAASGERAVAMCRETAYPVVLMDLVLPDIPGTEALSRIRRDDPGAAVIMVTAYASLESAIAALKAGAYDYIRKPVVREDLLRAVERALERQQLARRNQLLVGELQARLEEVKALAREKEEVFRILDEGLVILEEGGRIVDLNRRAAELLSPVGDLVAGDDFFRSGFPLPDGFLSQVAAADGRPVRAVLASGEGPSRRDLELVGLAMGRVGAGRRLLLSLRDLTGLRELERRREEFLAIVSHDLKAPLTSLKGFAELLAGGDYDAPETWRKYVGIIGSETDRMTALVDDLLDLGRIEAGRMPLRPERLTVRDLVAYCARSLDSLVRQRGLTMRAEVEDADRLAFLGDRQRVLQVLMNLYANAVRFSPQGGAIETSARLEGGQVLLWIDDEGPGVPPSERERIFEKYQQAGPPASGRAKGSGLGLAIVKALVEIHGGSVAVEGRGDRPGSRFVVRLPAAPTEV